MDQDNEKEEEYEILLCPDQGVTPTLGLLRDNEGLFERFEVPGSNCVLYFPSGIVCRHLRISTIRAFNDDALRIYHAFVVIEKIMDPHSNSVNDVFANDTSGPQEFIVVRQNKSNKGIMRIGLPINDKWRRLKSKKGTVILNKGDTYKVSLHCRPYQSDILSGNEDASKGKSSKARKNVFHSEHAALYGFSGIACCSLKFSGPSNPTII